MKNPFKNNSLASALLGYILGAGTVAGGSALLSTSGSVEPSISSFYDGSYESNDKDTRFHGLPNDEDGDVVITPSGKCYHSIYGCISLRNSSNIRTVKREDAESKGIYACSKCNP